MQVNSVLCKGWNTASHWPSLFGCGSITLGIILLPHNITSLDERQAQSQDSLKSWLSNNKNWGGGQKWLWSSLFLRFLDLYALTPQYSTEQKSYNQEHKGSHIPTVTPRRKLCAHWLRQVWNFTLALFLLPLTKLKHDSLFLPKNFLS